MARPTTSGTASSGFDDGLPLYVLEPERHPRLPHPQRTAATGTIEAPPPPAPQPPVRAVPLTSGPERPRPQVEPLGTFIHSILLRPDLIPSLLTRWWSENAAAGRVVVDRRLVILGIPDRPNRYGAWVLPARLGRWLPLRARVELVPRLSFSTVVLLRPKRHRWASRAYYRYGHRALERFEAALVRLAGS